MNWKSVGIVMGGWAALFAAGQWAGKRFSPDWENPDQVKVWAASQLDYRLETQAPKPSEFFSVRLKTQNAEPTGVFSLRCGPDTFSYRMGTLFPKIENVPGVWQGKEVKRKPFSAADVNAFAKLLGLPAFATAPALIEALKSLKSENYVLAMGVGALAGFGLGFYLDYETAPSCPEVKTALKEPEFWRSLEAPATVKFYATGAGVRLLPSASGLYKAGH